MAGVTVTHNFVSAVTDDSDASTLSPSNWNDSHSVLLGILAKTADYTLANADNGSLVEFNSASALVATLPQANATTFKSGWFVWIKNKGAGTVTITPTTSLIDGGVTLSVRTGETAFVVSNGTNYVSIVSYSALLDGIITAASTEAFVVGPNGLINPTFQVDTSATSAATGVKITSAASTFGVTVSVISPNSADALKIDAKGIGALTVQSVATGNFIVGTGMTVTPAGAVSGITTLASNAHTIAATTSAALTVGRNGATNPALQVDAATASSATGLKITSAAAAAGVALAVISSGTNEALTVDAKGSGNLTVQSVGTGNFKVGTGLTVTPAGAVSGVTTLGTTGDITITKSLPALRLIGTRSWALIESAGDLFIEDLTIPTARFSINSTGTVTIFQALNVGGDLTVTGNVVSPTLSGTPIAPTAAAGTNTTQLATTAHVFAERTNAATLTNKILTSPVVNTPTGIAKGDVGLGNVDNTSDANKPVSTAQQTALDLKANLASPTLTGTPLGPTAGAGTNTTQLATTAFVQTAASTGAWTDYSPTITAGSGTFTSVTATEARYRIVGKTAEVRLKLTLTTIGSAASYTQVTLPFTVATTSAGHGYNATGPVLLVVQSKISSSTSLLFQASGGGFGWTSGDIVYIFLTFEVA